MPIPCKMRYRKGATDSSLGRVLGVRNCGGREEVLGGEFKSWAYFCC